MFADLESHAGFEYDQQKADEAIAQETATTAQADHLAMRRFQSSVEAVIYRRDTEEDHRRMAAAARVKQEIKRKQAAELHESPAVLRRFEVNIMVALIVHSGQTSQRRLVVMPAHIPYSSLAGW
eukprot:247791-Prymnesium_polylepis.1